MVSVCGVFLVFFIDVCGIFIVCMFSFVDDGVCVVGIFGRVFLVFGVGCVKVCSVSVLVNVISK